MKTNKQICKLLVAISAFWLTTPYGYQANAATIGYVTTFGAFYHLEEILCHQAVYQLDISPLHCPQLLT